MGRVAGVTSEETRRRLLDAAAEAFEKDGFEGTRVADIAARASVSNGALYSHYRSKAELLAAAVLDRGTIDLAALFLSRPDESIVDPLLDIGRHLVDVPLSKGALLVEALVAARRDGDVADMASAGLSDRLKWLEDRVRAGQEDGTIRSDISAAGMSRFFALLLFGSLLLAPADLPKVRPDEWDHLINELALAMAGPAVKPPTV